MKVRKKPIIVDAVQYERGLGMEDGFVYGEFVDGKFIHTAPFDRNTLPMPYIDTLEGQMIISEGDYIITGIKGERYPIKHDIFEETYDILDSSEVPHCLDGSICTSDKVVEHEQTMDTLVQRLNAVELKLHRLADMAQDAWSSLDARL